MMLSKLSLQEWSKYNVSSTVTRASYVTTGSVVYVYVYDTWSTIQEFPNFQNFSKSKNWELQSLAKFGTTPFHVLSDFRS